MTGEYKSATLARTQTTHSRGSVSVERLEWVSGNLGILTSFVRAVVVFCSTHCYQFHTHLKIGLTHLLDNVSHCERTRDLRIQARIRPTQNCADIRIHFYACRKLPYAAYTFTIKNDPFVKRSLYSKPCFVISDHLTLYSYSQPINYFQVAQRFPPTVQPGE